MPVQAPPGYRYENGRLVRDDFSGPTSIGTRFGETLKRTQAVDAAGGDVPANHYVGPTGELRENDGLPWWAIAGAAAAPLAGAFLPAMFGAGATGGAAGTGAATGAGTGAAAAGGLGGALKGLVTNPSNLMDLAGVITALAGASRGGNGQASAEAQRLNQITEERMRRVDPLHQAITQLAWGRLPMNARQGIPAPTYSPLPK